MIVVDVGCARHGTRRNSSISRLRRRFRPEMIYGFDPLARPYRRPGIEVRREAAWLYDGEVGFVAAGTESHLDYGSELRVRCFDLARFVGQLPPHDLVLKLDVEGAEYDLLARLCEAGLDWRLSLALVEWHGEHEHPPLACPVEEWIW